MADPLARDRQRLLHMLRELSFERRSVTLASGQPSDFYIDCRRTALTAEGHFLIGRLLWNSIRVHAPEARAVGGLTLGADPLASAVSLTSYLAGQPLTAFLVRKEAKGHGTGQWIEGRALLVKGDRVAIVDDVVTTGGSTLKALERVREEGLDPVAAFALVDRAEGGREAIEATGIKLHALFSRSDFMGSH
jgi:orotate phosphoribosyltransferase